MYVTFFYPLNRSLFPKKWQRPVSFYYEKFQQLLEKNVEEIIVYSSDLNIQSICKKFFHVQFIFWEIEKFWIWKKRKIIQECLNKNFFSFNVPEFFSVDYIALQLCKFEALYLASLLTINPVVWIDAGILYIPKVNTISSFQIHWTKPGIHAIQFTAKPCNERWITLVPGAYIMGGCFGGYGVYIRRLFYESKILLEELWEKHISANDQQILSILHYRKPNLFHLQKAFKQWIPFYGSGFWNSALLIIESEEKENYKNYQWISLLLVFCILFYYYKK